jgi:carbonic anhydrase
VEGGFRWAPFGPSSTPAATPAAAPADAVPARRMAVICCMDARLDPLRVLGLKLGDAHVIRNAGAVVTDDVVQSLAASRELAGTRAAVLVAHSDCMAHGSDDDVARAVVRNGMRRLRDAVPGIEVSGVFYDVATRRVSGV